MNPTSPIWPGNPASPLWPGRLAQGSGTVFVPIWLVVLIVVVLVVVIVWFVLED